MSAISYEHPARSAVGYALCASSMIMYSRAFNSMAICTIIRLCMQLRDFRHPF